MKLVIKILVALFGVIVLVVVIGAVLVFNSIDTIAKRVIEEGGTYATGVSTTVDSADVGVFAGTFEMAGLNIANPEGYKSPHFLNMGDASVAVSYSTLKQDVVTLPTLTLKDIDLYLDKSGGKANYQAILDNLKRFESSDKPSEPAEPKGKGSGKKFVIDLVTIDGVDVHLAGIPGISQAMGDVAVKVPKIELKGVGSQDGGMTMPELINLIVKAVLTASVEAGGGIIPADVLGDLQGQLAQLTDLGSLGVNLTTGLGDLGKQVQEKAQEQVEGAVDNAKEKLEGAADDAQKKVEDATNEAKDKLEGLLGGKKDEP